MSLSESQTPRPSIAIDDLFRALPDINLNIVAVVLRQYGIPSETIRSAGMDMIRQGYTAQQYAVGPSPLKQLSIAARAEWAPTYAAYDRSLIRALRRSVRFEVANLDSETILREHPAIVRGDVVHVRGADNYRNSGCYIWGGERASELHTGIDDYGCVPPTYTLREFPDPEHFDNSIAHNTIRWLGFTVEEITRFVTGKSFDVTIEAKKYSVSLSKIPKWYNRREECKQSKSIAQLYEALPQPLPVSINGDGYVWRLSVSD
jgi:hypothetical protein